MTVKTISVLNIPVVATTMRDAISCFENETGISNLNGQYVCFMNVHTAVTAYDNPEYMQVMHEAGIVFPDGKPIAREVRKQSDFSSEKVSGPDFFMEIMAHSEENNWTHYFYGGSEETLAGIRTRLLALCPNLQIKGMYSPPFRKLEEEEKAADIERIRKADADFIWIGLGAPKQENWMYAHKGMFRGVMFGVGAAFDFAAGTVKRAPLWMQKCSLEWLYRLFQDPKRLWKRYLKTNGRFMWLKLYRKSL